MQKKKESQMEKMTGIKKITCSNCMYKACCMESSRDYACTDYKVHITKKESRKQN